MSTKHAMFGFTKLLSMSSMDAKKGRESPPQDRHDCAGTFARWVLSWAILPCSRTRGGELA
eukprot:2190912-Amphidinium_carterae.2